MGNHIKLLEKTYGVGTPIPQPLITELAYKALELNQLRISLDLFALNLSNFPLYWNSYDCLGDYYSEISDYENALKFYKKAYSILPYFPIKAKIKNIKQNRL
jgi:tetratricopeptide (TPR) repeat protein